MLTFFSWLASFFNARPVEEPDYTDAITAYRDAVIADAGFLDRYNREVLNSRVLKTFAEVAVLPNTELLRQWHDTVLHLKGRLLELPLPDDVQEAIERITNNATTYFGEYIR